MPCRQGDQYIIGKLVCDEIDESLKYSGKRPFLSVFEGVIISLLVSKRNYIEDKQVKRFKILSDIKGGILGEIAYRAIASKYG